MIAARIALSVVMLVLLVSCSSTRRGGYYQDDGPPDKAVDLSSIPDAVPRPEPLSRTGNKPYDVFGKHYVPMTSAQGFYQKGIASWYGKQFHGRRTSSGEPYDMYAMTAAHPVLPLPSYVRVTNVANGRSVIVRVNDRGPFKSSRIMDLSYAAAWRLGMIGTGTALVEIAAIGENASQQKPAAEAPRPTASRHRLYIQLGAFLDVNTAHRLRKQLVEEGFQDASVTKTMRDELYLYRVRLGPLKSLRQGNDLLAELREAGHVQAKIIND